ncbi:tetratricopeptide repeat protein, partial [Flavobacteriaceae bacterium]|nr:tetratricopeptide repeat protein [Flavobacteriaceae bacterium]
ELAQEVKINKNLYALYETEDWGEIDILNKDGIDYQEYLLSDDANKIKKAIHNANTKYNLNNITPTKYFKRYGIAASLILLIALGYTIETHEDSSKNLYIEFVNPSELPSLTNRSDADKLLSDAEELFINKQYTGALRSLELYDEKYETKSINALLYKGMCHLELNQYSEASTIFNTIKNSDSLDKNKAYWYLAATSLKQEDIDTAKKILQFIVDNSYFNHRKAKDLLKKIN